MIYRFRLVSDEVDNFKREIEIDADSTFLDLRNAINAAVEYEPEPMCSFFICEDGWEKGREITLEDMGADASQDVYLMDETVISDMVEDEGQRLIFVFDYMTERAFFIELKESRPGEFLPAPVCVASRGKAPQQQVDLDIFEEKIDKKAAAEAKKQQLDLEDEELFGQGGYDDEDLDGLGEMSMDDLY
ncbi:MAG: hypothetical protein NC336_10100 [Clostridium sp.]|nr:hypothetical protein [Clostridium sp.]